VGRRGQATGGFTAEDFQQFADNATWTFAKTMPNNPHEWTQRKDHPREDFEAAVRFVYTSPDSRIVNFGDRPYVVYDYGPNRYWAQGWPVRKTTIINRALN
jgi:hypothetical protein